MTKKVNRRIKIKHQNTLVDFIQRKTGKGAEDLQNLRRGGNSISKTVFSVN